MTTMKVNVACCQVAPHIGELAFNRALVERVTRRAASLGAQVVVLPELVQSGYLFRDPAEARALAEPLDGPGITLWTALAAELGIVLVGGFCELRDDGTLANSAALVDASGVRAVYRKAHLWDGEKAIFTPGDAAGHGLRAPRGDDLLRPRVSRMGAPARAGRCPVALCAGELATGPAPGRRAPG